MRRLILLLLAVWALVPLSARAAEWRASDDDALLFDLRSGPLRLGDGIRGYARPDDECVVLGDVILALDLPVRLDRTAGRASGWVFAEDETIAVDRPAGTVALGGRVRPLDPGAISDAPEGWCVGTAALARWLGVTLAVDRPNASLILTASRKLPFELAAERRQRAAGLRPARSFDLASLPQAATPYRAWRTPAVDVVASAGLTTGGARTRRSDARYEVFAAGELAGVSVEARLSSDTTGVPDRLRARAFRADPDGGLPLGATLIEAGDVTGVASPLATASLVGRGVTVTNRPLTQPDSFSTTSFAGDLPAGWEAELYRNDQLLAFATPRDDGRYEFRSVPLAFGSNAFAVVLYGPQGQVRRDERTLRVGANSIPPERTWYWISAADAGHDLFAWRNVPRGTFDGPRVSAGLERGLSRRTSVFAFAHTLVAERGRRTILEGGARQAFGGFLAEASAARDVGGGWAARLDLLGGGGRTTWTAQALTAHDYLSDRVDRFTRALVTGAVDTVLGGARGAVPVRGELRVRRTVDGSARVEAGLRASRSLGRFYLTAQLDWNRQSTRLGGLIGPGVDATGFSRPAGVVTSPGTLDELSAALLASGTVGGVRLRAAARFALAPAARLDTLEASGEWTAGERGRWRAELGWSGGRGGVGFGAAGGRGSLGRVGLGYSRRLDRFALGGRVEAATDGGLAAGVDLQFSLAPKEGGGLRLSSSRLGAQGRAEVRVFRDVNGDGVRQPGEPLEPDVQLVAGQAVVRALTDRSGRAVVDGLTPFRAVLIGVDAGSLADPFLLPVGPGKVVVPRPGVATVVELPLSAAGSVEGELRGARGSTLGGVELELVDGRGVVVASTRSEFDGFFLFDRVPYGRFTLRIQALSAAAVKARPELDRTVEVGEAHPTATLGPLTPTPLIPDTLAAAGAGE